MLTVPYLQRYTSYQQIDVHKNLHFSSCHPREREESIPYSQAKRYRRKISDNGSFHRSLEELKGNFLNKQYPENVIDSACKMVSPQTQEAALVYSDVKNKEKKIVPFVVPYNTSLSNLGLAINKYWALFDLSSKDSFNCLRINCLHKQKPVIAFKRAKKVKTVYHIQYRIRPMKVASLQNETGADVNTVVPL